MADPLIIGAAALAWNEYEAVAYGDRRVALSPSASIDRHRDELERQLADGAVIYSVTTGAGADAGHERPSDAIERAEQNAVRSHAVGVGAPASTPIVRGAMLLQAWGYAQGPPAVRRVIVDRLLTMLNDRLHPVVPLGGSVSASDLVPSAHIALAVVGEGHVSVDAGQRGASRAGLAPVALAAKEGGIVNNNAFTSALAFDAVRSAERLVERTEAVAAMTLQALRGYPEAFDADLIALRPHPGARAAAAHMRMLLRGTELMRAPGRPHDPFSLRCLPQVHGAVRDAIGFARDAVAVELGSVTDNPVVLADGGRVLSGGNFHGEPIALPLDLLAAAVGRLAALSRRRTHHLIHPLWDVGLPPRLTNDPDGGYGLLMLDSLAAAITAECQARARAARTTPTDVDGMEDHVSMAALTAREAGAAVDLARQVVAVELCRAAQALKLQGTERASRAARELHAAARERLLFVADDQPIDVQPLTELL